LYINDTYFSLSFGCKRSLQANPSEIHKEYYTSFGKINKTDVEGLQKMEVRAISN